MKDVITGDDIYASVIMLQTADSRTVVALEGPSDCDCLAPHIDEEAAQVLPCHGQLNLDRLMMLIDQNEIEGVVAIRDSDWAGFIHPVPASANIVVTDLYDLDASVMIRTEVGRRIALVFGDATRVGQHCGSLKMASPIDAAVQIASRIGDLRLISARLALGLSLRDLPMAEIVDCGTASVADQKLLSIAVSRTKDCPISVDQLAVFLAATDASSPGPRERLCSGHDLAAALSLMIRKVWGGAGVRKELLLQAVRSALSCAELQTLELFRAVQAWEARTGRRVWRCSPLTAPGGEAAA